MKPAKKTRRPQPIDPDLLKALRPELRAGRRPEEIVLDMVLDDLAEDFRRTGKVVGYDTLSKITRVNWRTIRSYVRTLGPQDSNHDLRKEIIRRSHLHTSHAPWSPCRSEMPSSEPPESAQGRGSTSQTAPTALAGDPAVIRNNITNSQEPYMGATPTSQLDLALTTIREASEDQIRALDQQPQQYAKYIRSGRRPTTKGQVDFAQQIAVMLEDPSTNSGRRALEYRRSLEQLLVTQHRAAREARAHDDEAEVLLRRYSGRGARSPVEEGGRYLGISQKLGQSALPSVTINSVPTKSGAEHPQPGI